MAVLGLVLGVVALVVAAAPLASGSVGPLILMAGNVWFSVLVLGMAAAGVVLSVLGLKAAKRTGRARKKAVAGLILSVIPIVMMLGVYTYVLTRPAETRGETKGSQEETVTLDLEKIAEQALKGSKPSTPK